MNAPVLPCDDCRIADICGLKGSRKHAVNRVDRILEGFDDGFLEIPVICHRQQKAEAATEEDQALPVGESTDAELPGQLRVEEGDAGRGDAAAGTLLDVRDRMADRGGEESTGGAIG